LAMESLVVECVDDSYGEKATRQLVEDVLADLSLVNVFKRVRVYVDAGEPVFIFAATLRQASSDVTLGDVAKIGLGGELGSGEVEIKLFKEAYLTKLLDLLFERYGREGVHQPERTVMVVKPPEPDREIEELKRLVVEEPAQEMRTKMIDAIALRIIPEAFRVRKYEMTQDHVLFVSSEDTLKPEWLEKGREVLELVEQESI